MRIKGYGSIANLGTIPGKTGLSLPCTSSPTAREASIRLSLCFFTSTISRDDIIIPDLTQKDKSRVSEPARQRSYTRFRERVAARRRVAELARKEC